MSSKPTHQDLENAGPSRRPSWLASVFGGRNVVIGPRIEPLPEDNFRTIHDSDTQASDLADKQLTSEVGNAIQYRTCSWQKTAGLLFSEYIVLSVMTFPWSYSLLGLIPGLILTAVIASVVLYTSLILWEFCLRHPEVRDICDIGQILFWDKKWAWWWTAAMFTLNNTFIQALHVLVGAIYLNTMTDANPLKACRTVTFAAVITIISWLGSLPRTFDMMAKLGAISTFFTFVSIILAVSFTVSQGDPAGYPSLGEPIVSMWTPRTTNLVTGMSAFMNMSYTFMGQLTLPSFIAEMREPRDFPKALWACTIAEIITFSIVGTVIYIYTGNQYMMTPAFGALETVYKKVSYSFMVPTIIFVGCLYASLNGRFIFFRMFQDSRHVTEHTFKGWFWWVVLLFISWTFAFLIAEIIPFFQSLLSVMSSLFSCWFGLIFWGLAYFRMRGADQKIRKSRKSLLDYLSIGLNIIIILTGFLYLTLGTYASVEEIINQFEEGSVSGVFSCRSNAL